MSSLEIILELSRSHLEPGLFDLCYLSPDIDDDLWCFGYCSDPELSVGNCFESIPRRGRKHLVTFLCGLRDQVTQPLGIEPENRKMQALA
jgi:hypothetical protein